VKTARPLFVAAILVAGVALPLRAHAARATVALDVDACAEVPELALRQIVSIEIGDLLAPRGGDAPRNGYRLTARCIGRSAHLEARAVERTDGLERTLSLDDFPGDAAPRALALAGIEMLAALDPAVRARVEAKSASDAPPLATDGFALALSGVYRAFFGTAGATGWGGRAGLDWRRGAEILAVDLEIDRASSTIALGETRAWLASVGLFGGVALGGERAGCLLAAGARAGVARLSGEPAPGANLVGDSVTRPWWGPAVAARLWMGGARIAALLSVEAGWVVHGAQGLAGGTTAIAVEGGWAMVGAGARF
jgi:hypothetical protein